MKAQKETFAEQLEGIKGAITLARDQQEEVVAEDVQVPHQNQEIVEALKADASASEDGKTVPVVGSTAVIEEKKEEAQAGDLPLAPRSPEDIRRARRAHLERLKKGTGKPAAERERGEIGDEDDPVENFLFFLGDQHRLEQRINELRGIWEAQQENFSKGLTMSSIVALAEKTFRQAERELSQVLIDIADYRVRFPGIDEQVVERDLSNARNRRLTQEIRGVKDVNPAVIFGFVRLALENGAIKAGKGPEAFYWADAAYVMAIENLVVTELFEALSALISGYREAEAAKIREEEQKREAYLAGVKRYLISWDALEAVRQGDGTVRLIPFLEGRGEKSILFVFGPLDDVLAEEERRCYGRSDQEEHFGQAVLERVSGCKVRCTLTTHADTAYRIFLPYNKRESRREERVVEFEISLATLNKDLAQKPVPALFRYSIRRQIWFEQKKAAEEERKRRQEDAKRKAESAEIRDVFTLDQPITLHELRGNKMGTALVEAGIPGEDGRKRWLVCHFQRVGRDQWYVSRMITGTLRMFPELAKYADPKHPASTQAFYQDEFLKKVMWHNRSSERDWRLRLLARKHQAEALDEGTCQNLFSVCAEDDDGKVYALRGILEVRVADKVRKDQVGFIVKRQGQETETATLTILDAVPGASAKLVKDLVGRGLPLVDLPEEWRKVLKRTCAFLLGESNVPEYLQSSSPVSSPEVSEGDESKDETPAENE